MTSLPLALANQTRETFTPEEIAIPPRLRSGINDASVMSLMQSIESIGLRTPITVRWDKDGDDDVVVLVAGMHRLEACKRLGLELVDCIVFRGSDTEARRWEISENLHRADLTVQERAEHIAEWVKLTAKEFVCSVCSERFADPVWHCSKCAHHLVMDADKCPFCHKGKRPDKPAQVGQVSNKGGRGNKGGISAAVRELGISRQEAQRAIKIAGMDKEVKETATEAGISDNQSALLRVADQPSAERQLAAIRREQDDAEAHRRNRESDRVIALTEAQPFAEWLMAHMDLAELPTVISLLEGCKPRDVIASLLGKLAT